MVDTLSKVGISHGNNDLARDSLKDVIAIQITSWPLATKHAITIGIGQRQDVATVRHTTFPNFIGSVLFKRTCCGAGDLISSLVHNGPPHLFRPTIRGNR